MTSYKLYYAILQNKPTPATFSGNSLQINLQWITKRDMEGLWPGKRIIGQVAGHKINLETEGVQDKKN